MAKSKQAKAKAPTAKKPAMLKPAKKKTPSKGAPAKDSQVINNQKAILANQDQVLSRLASIEASLSKLDETVRGMCGSQSEPVEVEKSNGSMSEDKSELAM